MSQRMGMHMEEIKRPKYVAEVTRKFGDTPDTEIFSQLAKVALGIDVKFTKDDKKKGVGTAL